MNKYLSDNIDDFFSSRLKNYSEEPDQNIWNEIDKNLSVSKKNGSAIFRTSISGSIAIILFCLCTPFFIKDNLMHHNGTAQNKTHKHTSNDYNKAPAIVFNNTVKINDRFTGNIVNNQETKSIRNPLPKDYSVAILPSNVSSNAGTNLERLHDFVPHDFFIIDSGQNKELSEYSSSSTIVKLRNKHVFSLMPFFSADHITGRFIEQYKFDNLDKNDLAGREKPDMSFTAGVLAGYQLNKKLSLVSGISYSSSKLSVAGTAVKALQNNNGEYIFKLATSYGFAEIRKKGMDPVAGDTLLVSSAGINFSYISLPLMINYDLSDRKLKFSIHGGVAVNIITNEKVEAEYKVQNNSEVETTNKIEGIKKTFFTLNTGIEAKYELNHTTDISIGPELRYGINAINKGTPVKTYPVNYGLALKLSFKL
jgi:hypothetical protein